MITNAAPKYRDKNALRGKEKPQISKKTVIGLSRRKTDRLH